MLIAPILMITQTVGCDPDLRWASTPAGRRRSATTARLTFTEAMHFARWHTVIGVVVAVIAWKVSPGLLVWMSPVVAGLLLAGPVSWLTSRHAGAFSRWALATREEIASAGDRRAGGARRAKRGVCG